MAFSAENRDGARAGKASGIGGSELKSSQNENLRH
jgi:hypothetical protein